MNDSGINYDRLCKFCSTADFELALSGRTMVLSDKLSQMFQYTHERLDSEACAIGEMEKNILEILSRSIDRPEILRHAMKDFDHSRFSPDHNWRNIILSVISDANAEFETLMRIALLKYMQYLNSRREIIRILCRLI